MNVKPKPTGCFDTVCAEIRAIRAQGQVARGISEELDRQGVMVALGISEEDWRKHAGMALSVGVPQFHDDASPEETLATAARSLDELLSEVDPQVEQVVEAEVQKRLASGTSPDAVAKWVMDLIGRIKAEMGERSPSDAATQIRSRLGIDLATWLLKGEPR